MGVQYDVISLLTAALILLVAGSYIRLAKRQSLVIAIVACWVISTFVFTYFFRFQGEAWMWRSTKAPLSSELGLVIDTIRMSMPGIVAFGVNRITKIKRDTPNIQFDADKQASSGKLK